MFAAIGRFAYRRRRVVLAAWAAAFVAGLAASIGLPGVLKGGGFTRADSPSQQAQRVMQERLGVGPTHLTIVFTSDELDARGREFRAAQERALARLTPARAARSHRDRDRGLERQQRADLQRRALVAGRPLVQRQARAGAGPDPPHS